MLTPEQIETKLDRILLKVQKPGRYVGGELNSVVKDWDSADVRVALVFPDIYDIGVSNVGLKILYDQVNQRGDALAERAYAPWTDMEALMRAEGIPLYALESKRPLSGFDLVGFSLPYETLYTNALNLLDLAGIPLRAGERGAEHPIVIAGGHSTINPEPMHAFMDAFVIGEGEEVIIETIFSLLSLKSPACTSRASTSRITWTMGPSRAWRLSPRGSPTPSSSASSPNCLRRRRSSSCRTSKSSTTVPRWRSRAAARAGVGTATRA